MFTEEAIQNPATEKEVDEVIKLARTEYDKMKIINPEKRNEILLGLIMKKLRGRTPAKVIANKIGFVKGVK